MRLLELGKELKISKMETLVRFIKRNYLFILFILFLITFSIFVPVLGDDLLHGSYGVGLNFMPKVNGRYLGNLFGVNMSSSLIIRIFVRTAVVLGIVYLIYKMTGDKRRSFIALAIGAFLLTPVEIFRQAIVNSSCFANYVIPTLGILVVMYIFFNRKATMNKWWMIGLLVLGIVNSLFVEHVTIFNFLLSIFMFLYSVIKKRKEKYVYLMYMVGSVLGTFIMFSNPVYFLSFRGEDTYRSFNSISAIFGRFFVITDDAFFNDKVSLYLSIVTSLVLLCNKNLKRRKLSIVLITYIAMFLVYSIFSHEIKIDLFLDNKVYFNTIFSGVYLFSLFLVVSISDFKKSDKFYLYFMLACFILVLAPLLVVSPIGTRCYYSAYIFFALFNLKYASLVYKCEIFDKKKIEIVLSVLVICIMARYLYIYGTVYVASNDRYENIVRELANGYDTVDFPILPFNQYLHGEAYCYKYYADSYKKYYNIDDNINFRMTGCVIQGD